jgi:hypothetical protein
MKYVKIVLKIFKWIFLTIIMFVIVTEGVLRISCKQLLVRWNTFAYQSDTLLGYRYLLNSSGIIHNSAYINYYKINKFGFPDNDFSIPKKDGMFRIIIVGTSDDTGLCTNGPLNYCKIANNNFRQNDDNVEILNCSIDGEKRSFVNYNFILNEGVKYEPDLILFRLSEFPLVDQMRYRATYKGIRINYAEKNESLDSSKLFIDKYLINKTSFSYLYDCSYIVRGIVRYFINHKDDKKDKIISYLKKHVIKNQKLVVGYVRGEINNWSKVRRSKKEMKKFEAKTFTKDKSIKLLVDLQQQLLKKDISLVLFRIYNGFENTSLCDTLCNSGLTFMALQVPNCDNCTFGELDGHSTQQGHKAIALSLYNKLVNHYIPKAYLNSKNL